MSLILNDATLFKEWKEDIKTMSGRIIEMRKELHRLLTEKYHTPGNWDHIVNQIGMFRYSFFFHVKRKDADQMYYLVLQGSAISRANGLWKRSTFI